LPEYLAPVEWAMFGPNGEIWLKRQMPGKGHESEWLVVDSLFVPIARAIAPVPGFGFIDGQAWGSDQDAEGTPYVVRLRINPVR
jgi:hypothetical protein